jgi:hypothetical protein
MFTRLLPIVTALIVGGLNLPKTLAEPVIDAGYTSCAFNQEMEKCHITFFEDQDLDIRMYRVQWLSDGKVVEYFMSDCWMGENDHTMCQVRITEDNGQVSQGVAELGCIGPFITSENGNTTGLRFIPDTDNAVF